MTTGQPALRRQAPPAQRDLPTGRPAWRRIVLPGAQVEFAPQWLPDAAACEWLRVLRHAIPWEQHRIRLFGREVASPRLSCWMGDPGAGYTYAGRKPFRTGFDHVG